MTELAIIIGAGPQSPVAGEGRGSSSRTLTAEETIA